MRAVYAMPSGGLSRARRLLARTGWLVEPAPDGGADDAPAAVELAAMGRPVVFMPRTAPVARALRRIAVVHGGSRGETRGIEVADAAAVATGAEIVTLHAPAAHRPGDPAGLPFGLGDHPEHDWAEWREEFARRFCPCSEGVAISVRLVSGPPVGAVAREAGRIAADLLVVSVVRRSDAGEAELLAGIVAAAPCPTLILPPPAEPRQHRG
jgi:nucleotide-binding universal stress UspA family protein